MPIYSGNTKDSIWRRWVYDRALPAYAEIEVQNNATATTITSQNVAVQVEVFDTNDDSYNATPDHTNDHITIDKAGEYLVMLSASIDSIAGASSVMQVQIKKNNGASEIIPHMDRNLSGGGGETGVVSLTGVASLAVGDTIEMWIMNTTNTQNYVVEDASLTVLRIGD